MTLAKFRALQAQARKDATAPQLRHIADSLAACSFRRPELYAQLAFALAGRGIAYQLDTHRVGREDIAGVTRAPTDGDALDALERGVDDCDAKARLFVALCLARGLRAELVPVWRAASGALVFEPLPRAPGDELAHAYGAVWLGGRWLWAETTLVRACLGEDPRSVPKEPGGEWRNT